MHYRFYVTLTIFRNHPLMKLTEEQVKMDKRVACASPTTTKNVTGKFVNLIIGRPAVARLIFTIIIVVIVIIIGYYLRLDTGAIAAIAIASFWEAFNAFDKLFKSRRKNAVQVHSN